MINLYHAPFSCSLAVKAALTASGATFQTHKISFSDGDHLKPEFLKINPLAKVPAIEIAGDVLTEGAAINQFIAERFPEAGLMPENGSIQKAEALKWLQFMYSTLHPVFSRVFYPERYGNDNDAVKKLAEIELHKLMLMIDSQLGKFKFIAGDELTLADLYLMTAIHWESVLAKPILANYQHIARFEQDMFSKSIIGDVFSQEYGLQ